jgi:ATP-binding cassette subfamily C (CFTR/MRP) protein 1
VHAICTTVSYKPCCEVHCPFLKRRQAEGKISFTRGALILTKTRILNVFSRDVYVLDQVLARVVSAALRTFSMVLGKIWYLMSFPLLTSRRHRIHCLHQLSTIHICIASSYLVLPADHDLLLGNQPRVVGEMACCTGVSSPHSRKRLDAVTRSPIFTWFQETLSGLSTIRAFRHQNLFILNLQKRLDRNQMQYMASIDVNR